MSVTVAISLSVASSLAPNIIFASGLIIGSISFIAASTSTSETSPHILMIRSVAPSIVVSRSGDSIAFLIASLTLFSPCPSPIDIWARPFPLITVATSAKSRLTSAGKFIRSVIPLILCFNISSAFANASLKPSFTSTIFNNLSFEMLIKVSTFGNNLFIPLIALCILTFPSNLKGFVTTATVSIPSSFAILATIGAAPVPVPPPIPQVMKTISAFFWVSVSRSNARIASFDSFAALSPISGRAPQPLPPVIFSPIVTLFAARQCLKSCISVLTPTNSTPLTPSSIIRLTALLPAPPIPKTTILATGS